MLIAMLVTESLHTVWSTLRYLVPTSMTGCPTADTGSVCALGRSLVCDGMVKRVLTGGAYCYVHTT